MTSATPAVIATFQLTWWRAALAALVAMAAGAVNSVAGGGTLLSFPVLVALGVPAVSANVTNTIALVPGYLSGAHAQRENLAGNRARLRSLQAVSAAGGLTGSILLVVTSNQTFRAVVPFLILLACGLLAFQDRLRRFVSPGPPTPTAPAGLADTAAGPGLLAAVFAAAVYGGYFGAGLSIMLLAILGLAVHDTLMRLNVVKLVLSLTINLPAAAFLVFSGKCEWTLVPFMAVACLVGGHLGGLLGQRLHPEVIRIAVVVLGLAVALRFWL